MSLKPSLELKGRGRLGRLGELVGWRWWAAGLGLLIWAVLLVRLLSGAVEGGETTAAAPTPTRGGDIAATVAVVVAGLPTVTPGLVAPAGTLAERTANGSADRAALPVGSGQVRHWLEGRWSHLYGELTLRQTGSRLEGTFTHQLLPEAGTLEAVIESERVQGRWQAGQLAGRLAWQLAGEGTTFDGVLMLRDWPVRWCGARQEQPFAEGCGFAGQWVTQLERHQACPMTLTQIGQQISGRSCVGQLEGRVSTRRESDRWVLEGQWLVVDQRPGRLRLILADDQARQFRGHWLSDRPQAWCGWRTGAQPPLPCLSE